MLRKFNLFLPLLLLLITAGIALPQHRAKADTFCTQGLGWDGTTLDCGVSYTVNLDKSQYSPYEWIHTTGQLQSNVCSNVGGSYVYTTLYGSIVNVTGEATLFSGGVQNPYHDLINDPNDLNPTMGALSYFDGWFTAPGSAGNYTFRFHAHASALVRNFFGTTYQAFPAQDAYYDMGFSVATLTGTVQGYKVDGNGNALPTDFGAGISVGGQSSYGTNPYYIHNVPAGWQWITTTDVSQYGYMTAHNNYDSGGGWIYGTGASEYVPAGGALNEWWMYTLGNPYCTGSGNADPAQDWTWWEWKDFANGRFYQKLPWAQSDGCRPPPPINATASCNTAGTQATISWTAPSGFNTFYTRARYLGDGTDGSEFGYPAFDDNFVGTTKTFSTTPGKTYEWWIHTKVTGNGWYSNSVGGTFTCTAPPPTGNLNATGCTTSAPGGICAVPASWTANDPAWTPNGQTGEPLITVQVFSGANHPLSGIYDPTVASSGGVYGDNARTGSQSITLPAGVYTFMLRIYDNPNGWFGVDEKNVTVTDPGARLCTPNSACTSTANSCGMTSGTCNVAGSVCTPPSDALCASSPPVCTPNSACTSAQNSCGMTSGTCNASGTVCVAPPDASCSNSCTLACTNGTTCVNNACVCPAGNFLVAGVCTAPAVTLTAPSIIPRGNSAKLKFSIAAATSCTLSGENGLSLPVTTSNPTVGVDSGIINSQTIFTLTCSFPDDTSLSTNKTVKIVPISGEK